MLVYVRVCVVLCDRLKEEPVYATERQQLIEHLVTAEGRVAVTGKDADRFNFKVPTLRNVELTYPYFHDGEAATLHQAVDIMGRLQLGRQFSKQEVEDVVAFLKTLTGKQPYFKLPILPPSSEKTPPPRPFD